MLGSLSLQSICLHYLQAAGARAAGRLPHRCVQCAGRRHQHCQLPSPRQPCHRSIACI